MWDLSFNQDQLQSLHWKAKSGPLDHQRNPCAIILSKPLFVKLLWRLHWCHFPPEKKDCRCVFSCLEAGQHGFQFKTIPLLEVFHITQVLWVRPQTCKKFDLWLYILRIFFLSSLSSCWYRYRNVCAFPLPYNFVQLSKAKLSDNRDWQSPTITVLSFVF